MMHFAYKQRKHFKYFESDLISLKQNKERPLPNKQHYVISLPIGKSKFTNLKNEF